MYYGNEILSHCGLYIVFTLIINVLVRVIRHVINPLGIEWMAGAKFYIIILTL